MGLVPFIDHVSSAVQSIFGRFIIDDRLYGQTPKSLPDLRIDEVRAVAGLAGHPIEQLIGAGGVLGRGQDEGRCVDDYQRRPASSASRMSAVVTREPCFLRLALIEAIASALLGFAATSVIIARMYCWIDWPFAFARPTITS